MTNEVIEVQGPVSRPDSVRHRLADAAWLSGASAFVANGVPFSFTTGPVLAGGVCELVAFLAEETLAQSITLHDAGAGTGYLTRHVIEALERRDPDLARACRYVASDSSAEAVAEMAGVFADLPGDLKERVTARTGNALSSDDILDGGPSVVLMSYLMDAVHPCTWPGLAMKFTKCWCRRG
jgi:SAM-dependent MidA family methyltransferase